MLPYVKAEEVTLLLSSKNNDQSLENSFDSILGLEVGGNVVTIILNLD